MSWVILLFSFYRWENGGAEKAWPQGGLIFHYLLWTTSALDLYFYLSPFRKSLPSPLPLPSPHPSTFILGSLACTPRPRPRPGKLAPWTPSTMASPLLGLLFRFRGVLTASTAQPGAEGIVVVGTCLNLFLPAWFWAIYLTSLGLFWAPINSSVTMDWMAVPTTEKHFAD